MSIRPWSLTPWSLPYVEGEVIEDSADFLEYMDCVAGVSDEDYDAAEFRVRVEADVRGCAGAPDEAEFSARLRLLAVVCADVIEAADFDADVQAAQVDIEAVFSETFDSSERLSGFASLGTESADAVTLQAGLLSRCAAGMIQFETADLSEIVSVTIGVQTISQEIIVLSLTLPPGGTLVLDGEHYTAALDGENVLHLTDGWVSLDDTVVEAFVDSGLGGAMGGNLRWRERWY